MYIRVHVIRQRADEQTTGTPEAAMDQIALAGVHRGSRPPEMTAAKECLGRTTRSRLADMFMFHGEHASTCCSECVGGTRCQAIISVLVESLRKECMVVSPEQKFWPCFPSALHAHYVLRYSGPCAHATPYHQ